MKGKRFCKKIMVMFFIITLLSYYVLPFKSAYATEWNTGTKAKIDINGNTNENSLVLNENMIGAEVENTAPSNVSESEEKDDSKTLNNVDFTSNLLVKPDLQIEDNNSSAESQEPEVQELKPEEDFSIVDVKEEKETILEDEGERFNALDDLMQNKSEDSLKNIDVISRLSINNLIKYDNEKGKGVILDVDLKFNYNFDSFNKEVNTDVSLEMPKLLDVLPSSYEINETSSNIIFNDVNESVEEEISKEEMQNKEAGSVYDLDEDSEMDDLEKDLQDVEQPEIKDNNSIEMEAKGDNNKFIPTKGIEEEIEVLEEKDVAEEQNVTEEPNVAEEQNVTEEPNVAEEQKVTEEPKAEISEIESENTIENTETVDKPDEENNVPKIVFSMKNMYNITDGSIRIIFMYPEEAIGAKSVEFKGELNISAEKSSGTEIKSLNNEVITKEFSLTKEIKESILTLGKYSTYSNTPSKYKGYFYANALSNTKKEIYYNTVSSAEIIDSFLVDDLIIEEKANSIERTNGDTIDLINLSYYRNSKINKEDFDKLLGENGLIEIYNQFDEKIGEITSNSEVLEDSYIYKYNKEYDNLKFVIKNIKNPGIIKIVNEKSIKENDNFSKVLVDSFESINFENISRVIKKIDTNEVPIQEVTSQGKISLEATETKMDLEFSSWSFSTEVDNNIIIDIKLKSDSEQYELFKNPAAEIEFPPSVEDVEIKKINLLYRNNLSLENWDVIENDNGAKVIKLKLEGVQDEYAPGKIIDGIDINIEAKIVLNRLTPNDQGNIKFKYSNEAGTRTTYQVEGKEFEEYTITYVNRDGLLKETKLENFNDEMDVIDEFNVDSVVGKLDVNSESKVSTMSATVLNNFSQDIEDVKIVGKIPCINNTDENGNNLSSNFDTVLQGNLTTSGVMAKILYSENEDEKIDGDGWKEDVEDYADMKAYKIELESETMHKGERIDFSYNTLIPEDIGYDSKSFGIYTVYYNYDGKILTETSTVGIITDGNKTSAAESDVVKDVSKLKIGIDSLIGTDKLKEEDLVKERQIIRYSVAIENTSEEAISNIEIKAKPHNANLYTFTEYVLLNYEGIEGETHFGEVEENKEKEYETDKIETIAPHSIAYFEFEVIVKSLSECSSDKTVYGDISIKADGIDEFSVQTNKNNIKSAKLELSIALDRGETLERDSIAFGAITQFVTTVKNISNSDINNVELKINIPSVLEYNESNEFEYINHLDVVGDNKVLTIIIPNITAGGEEKIFISTTTTSPENVSSYKIKLNSYTEVENEKYVSNECVYTAYQKSTKLEYVFEGDRQEEFVKDGDIITYKLTLKNTGLVEADKIIIENIYPEGLEIQNLYVTKNGERKEVTSESSDNITITTGADRGEEVLIEIVAKVSKEKYYAGQTLIENSLTISAPNIGDNINTNVVSYKISDFEQDDEEKEETGTLDDNDVSDQYKVPENSGEEEPDIPLEETNSNEDTSSDNNGTSNTNNNYESGSPDDLKDEDGENEGVEKADNTNNEDNIEESKSDTELNNNSDEDELNPDLEGDEEQNNSDENSYNEDNVDNSVDNSTGNEISNNSSNNEKDENNNKSSDEKNTLQNSVESENSESSNQEYSNSDLNTNQTKAETLQNTTKAIKKYKIQGRTWDDENRNGILEEEEKIISNMKVVLFKTVSKDNENKELTEEIGTTITDESGIYNFGELEEGNYIVLFEYDSENYLTTSYKSNKAREDESSDVISQMVEINGKKKEVALSDIIYLSENRLNVNAGVYERDTFDFSINKYILSAKVENAKGTEQYNYNDDEKLVKVEVPSKYLVGTKVTITYVIEAINEGDISGYVGKIVDYLPNGLEFDQELNKEWHLDEDGNLYNYSLMNKSIEPGKTAKLYLVLTKTLNENNTGTFENSAEIIEISNDRDKKDIDSTVNNKKTTEDDYSSVTIIITIKTGTVIYISVITLAIVLMAMLIYFIKYKPKNKKVII